MILTIQLEPPLRDRVHSILVGPGCTPLFSRAVVMKSLDVRNVVTTIEKEVVLVKMNLTFRHFVYCLAWGIIGIRLTANFS